MRWDEHLIRYYENLQPPPLQPPFEWLYPQREAAVRKIWAAFCRKYYHDAAKRVLFLGINPGRLGAGITGVNFTAPKQLSEVLGMEHPFGRGTELSAGFIYEVIEAYGGPEAFYGRFFLGSVCPFGLVKQGKNLNYYDDRALAEFLKPFMVQSIGRLIEGPVDRRTCICIGGEKNFRFLEGLNRQQGWFENVVHVPHPRFIMQYRRRQKQQFIQQYLQVMQDAVGGS